MVTVPVLSDEDERKRKEAPPVPVKEARAENEYDLLLKERPGALGNAPPAADGHAEGADWNEYDRLLREEDEGKRTALQTSLYLAGHTRPDEEAGLISLSKKTGIPVEALRSPTVKAEAVARQVSGSTDYDALIRNAPKTAEYLSRHDNARVAQDDIDSLAGIEEAIRYINAPPGELGPAHSTLGIASPSDRATAKRLGGLKGVGSAIVGGLKASPSSVSASLAEKGDIFWPEQLLRNVGLEDLADAPRYAGAYWREEAKRLRGTPPKPGTLASYAGQAAESVGMSLLAAPFGMSAAGVGPALAMFSLGAEGGYRDYLKAGYSPVAAGALSLSASSMEGLTEKIGLDALYKGGKPVIKKMASFLLGELAGEEINTIYSALEGKLNLHPEMTWADLGAQMIDTAIVTAMAGPMQGAIFRPAAKMAETLAGRAEQRDVYRQNREILTVLGDSAKASKLLERMPEKFKEAIASFKADGPVQDIGIPVEEWNTFWQEAGLDPARVAQEVLPDPKAYMEALATGSDVLIPLENYVTHLAGSEYHAGLLPNLRLRSGEMTGKELAAFEGNRTAILKETIDQAQEEEPAPTDQKVYEDVLAQLTKAGRAPNVAAREATLWQARYRTRAQRLGVDPYDLYRERKVTITASPAIEGVPDGALAQEGGKEKRGFVRFGPGGEVEIGLLEKANLSTFLHETGHAWLEELREDAVRENAPEQLASDWKLIAEHFGVADLALGATLPTKSHESFARSFEAYLMEGKAPSAELASAFQRFKAWLVQVYREISRLDVRLNADVRGVFDRLVATDEEITAAETRMRRTPLFATAEAAGMTAAEFAVHRKGIERAHIVGKERLERRLIAEYTRERDALWKEEREQVRAGVEEEANQNPLFQAFQNLTQGKTVGGETVGPPIKLSRTGLVAEFGEEFVKNLPAWTRQLYSAKGGMSPELVAEMFGFPSGRDLVQRLLDGPKRGEWIEQETDRRMRETHGDLLNDGSIAERALEAVHSDESGAVLREELRALRRKQLQVRPHVDQALKASEAQLRDARLAMESSIPPIAAFRQLARETVSKKSLLQLHPHLYAQAEAKADRKAFAAAARDDFETAAVEKQKQLLNHFLFLEATKARQEADSILRYMTGLTRSVAQERIGLAGGSFLEQLNAILDRYEFVKIPEAELARRKETLQGWAQRQQEEGYEPAIDPSLFMEGERVNYRTLTIEELQAVRDAALSIEHIARESRKMIAEGQAVEFGLGLALLQGRLQDENVARKPLPLTEHDMTWWEKRSVEARRLIGMFVRPETLIEWMDGGKSGPWHDLLWNLSVDAGNKRNQLRERVLVPLKGILDRIPKDRDARMFEKVAIKSLDGAELSRYTLIGIVLNAGNESNLDKLRRGGLWIGEKFYPLPDHILDEIRSKLDKGDWDLVQGLWDTANTLWPDVAEHSRQVSGVQVEKIEAKAFQTPFGEYQGGYWPMVYDYTHSEIGRKQTAANTPMDEIYGKNNTRAYTPKSHRTGRTGAAAPILFDWKRVATKHMNDVITDLSHWRFVNQVRRILADGTMRHAIITRMGEPAYRSLEGWLRFTVSGRFDGDPAADPLHRLMDGTITNVAVGALGFKVTTAWGNAVVAPIQAWGQVKAKWIARGMAEYVGNVSGTTEAVHELAPDMKYRKLQLDQSYQEIVDRLSGTRSIRKQVALVAMSVHAYSDQITSTAIWMGAYRQAVDEGKTQQEAVRFASSVISTTQLAGAPKDLSAFERDPRYRAWRLFLGPMIILQNRLRSVFREHGMKAFVRPEAIGKLLAYWIIPSIVYELAVGRGPGDDDDPAEWALLKILLYPSQMFPFLREASAFVEAKVRHQYGGYRMDTVSEAVKSIVEFGYAAADYAAGDEDLEKVVKTGIRASGPMLGVPATQLSITGEYVYDVMTGEYTPENPWDGFKDIFVRRPKK